MLPVRSLSLIPRTAILSHSSQRHPTHPLPPSSAMSIVSHHFQQQRKAGVAQQQRDHLKAKQTVQPSVPSVSTPQSQSSRFDVAALARAARIGTYGWESETDAEVLLRKFDMNVAWGPCTGVSRLQRWQRAQQLGLSPPEYIPSLLANVAAAAPTAQPITKAGVGSHSVFHTEVIGRF